MHVYILENTKEIFKVRIEEAREWFHYVKIDFGEVAGKHFLINVRPCSYMEL
jgi:hypothetical protein